MTILVYTAKYMPLEKIKPFFFSKFPDKFARLLFNFCGAILIAASVLYVVLTVILLWNAPTEILIGVGVFFFLRDVGRVIKDKK
jgi:hypothetical protein